MKDKKKAAGAGIGGLVILFALAASLGAKKAEAPPAVAAPAVTPPGVTPPAVTPPEEKPAVAPPEEKPAAEIHQEEIQERATEIEVTAQAQIQVGETTAPQLIDEIQYKRQELLNEAVMRTTDMQLALIHPGMTMEQADEIRTDIYDKTGADDLLDEVRSLALVEAKLKYVNGKNLEEVDQMAHTGEYAYPGGMWDWYTDHFLTTAKERQELGIS